MKGSKILSFGEVLWDKFPSGAKPGGAPMNAALHLREQGEDVRMVSRIGEDELGRKMTAYLKSKGMPLDLIQKDPNLHTGTVNVDVSDKENVKYEIVYPVAWDNIQPESALLEAAKDADCIIFGSLASRKEITRKTLLRLLEHDLLKIIDVNFRPPHYTETEVRQLLDHADIVKMNEEELEEISGWYDQKKGELEERLHKLAEIWGSNTICVTRGGGGAMIWQDGHIISQYGYKVDIADTVGAGDAFLAAVVKGILNEEKPEELLENACAIGAFVASQEGANPEYDWDKINKLKETAQK